MVVCMKCPIERNTKVIKKWNTNNKEGWKEYNRKMASMPEEKTKNYDQFETELNQILEETIGSTKIRTGGKRKDPRSKTHNDLRNEMKKQRKEFNKAIKENNENKEETMNNYITSQQRLREEIQQESQKRTEETIKKS